MPASGSDAKKRGRLPSSPGQNIPEEDFREHVGFLATMLICAACAVYLMGILRPIVRPLLWALFLVMGLQPAVVFVERVLLWKAAHAWRCCVIVLYCMYSGCRRCGCYRCCCTFGCCRRRYTRGRPLVEDGLDSGNGQSTNQLDAPSIIGSTGESSSADHAHGSAAGATILSATGDAASLAGSLAALTPLSTRSAAEIFSDLGGRSISKDHSADSDEEGDEPGVPWSYCARVIAKSLAIMLVTVAVLCAIGGFVIMLVDSFLKLKDHLDVYRKGAKNIAEAAEKLINRTVKDLPSNYTDAVAENVHDYAAHFVSFFLGEVLSNGVQFVIEILMMVLYIVFWLSDPMPVGNAMEELFKRYIILKGLACAGYGFCVGALLHVLSVDLAEVFGLAAFMLSFIPEAGAFLAIVLPAPVILFDSRLDRPVLTLFLATMGQLGLKFVFANVVEVKLVEADRIMRMHPVIILLVVAFFGYIWGPTGMLLSVPLVAYTKVVVLSDSVPPCYRNPVLVLLEGDRHAPARYAAMIGAKPNSPKGERRRSSGITSSTD
mmetsp:Transcript_27212/g.63369  ORF Transcript_27212/g.63369 Transcript_27212/m.63369 type:complete len:547 (-) Transcript_27212:120-1760(-)